MGIGLRSARNRLYAKCLLFLSSALLLNACATTIGQKPTDSAAIAIKDGVATKHDLSDSGDDLDAIPLEVNRLVLQWIDYFQGKGREHMERYLARSTRYVPVMKEILKKEGLPEDLVYIALIESGFAPAAKSTANAVGFWQFIKPTGKRYGLEINAFVDDRRDFIHSTVAAADYFKGLYNLFGSWYLAIASYNVGENRVKNVVMKYHTRDFWALARDGKLPVETVNYVPKFLAARLIAKSPEKYGFSDLEYQEPLDFADVEITSSVDLRRLAQGMGADYDDLHDLNPSFKRGVALLHGGKVHIRVPPEFKDKVAAAVPGAAIGNPKNYASQAEDDFITYRVRRGETLTSIARKFGTTTKKLRKLNRGHIRLNAGARLKVPGDDFTVLASEELQLPVGQRNLISKKKNRILGTKIHIVKRGDTLMGIATHYRVSLSELARRNALRHRARIAAGTRLEIPE